jgi:hypothetical protein
MCLHDVSDFVGSDTAGEVSSGYAAGAAAISRANGVIRVFARAVSRNQSPSRRLFSPPAGRPCPRWTRASPIARVRRKRAARSPRERGASMPARRADSA